MVLATSRIPRPLANNLAANRRLASNVSALPFGLIRPLFGIPVITLESDLPPSGKPWDQATGEQSSEWQDERKTLQAGKLWYGQTTART